jgi:hypothetical protein
MTYSEEELRTAVSASDSIAGALTLLGRVPKGGNYQSFHKFIKQYNIDTSHFTGQAHLAGKIIGPKRPVEDYLSNSFAIGSDALRRRLLKEKLFEYKCYSCGLSEWLNQPIPLELEHIDGNHANNLLENLTLLCPNCHAQTPTYRGRNRKLAGVAHLADARGLNPRSKEKNLEAGSNPVTRTCECGAKTMGKQCKHCFNLKRLPQINWPPLEELLDRLSKSNYSRLGRELGVSDNAIRKHIKKSLTD